MQVDIGSHNTFKACNTFKAWRTKLIFACTLIPLKKEATHSGVNSKLYPSKCVLISTNFKVYLLGKKLQVNLPQNKDVGIVIRLQK